MAFDSRLKEIMERNEGCDGLVVMEESGLCVGQTGLLKESHCAALTDIAAGVRQTVDIVSGLLETSEETEEGFDEWIAVTIQTKKKSSVLMSVADGLYVCIKRDTDKLATADPKAALPTVDQMPEAST